MYKSKAILDSVCRPDPVMDYQKQLFNVVAEKGIVMFTDKCGIDVSDPVASRILEAFVEY